MAVFVRILPFCGTTFGVYASDNLPYMTLRKYGLNTVTTERAIYGQHTVVNIVLMDDFL